MANDLYKLRRDRIALAVLSCFVFAVLLGGCRSPAPKASPTEQMESHIRQQDQTIESLQHELTEAKSELQAARRQVVEHAIVADAAPGAVTQAGFHPPRVVRVDINRLLSGGLDRDGVPGDETVTVLITPRDEHGEPLRGEGRLEIELLDFSRPMDQQRLAHWSWTEEETSEAWYSGVFGDGYRLTAPLPAQPVTGQLTVHARFFTPDNKQFDAVGPLLLRTGAAEASSSVVPSEPRRLPPK